MLLILLDTLQNKVVLSLARQHVLDANLLVCQVDSWEALQSFLQQFATLKPGPVARSAMHHVLTKAGNQGAATGIRGVDREMMSHASGIPPYATGLAPELEVFLEQAVAVVRQADSQAHIQLLTSTHMHLNMKYLVCVVCV